MTAGMKIYLLTSLLDPVVHFAQSRSDDASPESRADEQTPLASEIVAEPDGIDAVAEIAEEPVDDPDTDFGQCI